MSKPVSHQLDIYGAWLWVATDKPGWRTLQKRWNVGPVDALGGAVLEVDKTRPGNEPQVMVMIDVAKHQGDKHLMLNTVVHEATHAGTMLLDHIGQDYDGESEALAYLVGFIAAFAWEVCAG